MVQRVLVRAFEKIGSLRGATAIEGWLYRITSNAAGDLGRRARARSRALERFELEPGPTDHEVGQGMGAEELRELVRTFFEDLSEPQRAMMDLVDLQGMTPTEAGELLGLHPSTARVHLLRARRKVRARILERTPWVAEDLR